MVNDLSFSALSNCMYVYGSQIKKNKKKYLTLMTLNVEPLSIGSNTVNDSSFSALSHCWRVFGSQFKKGIQTEPNPNDSQCGNLVNWVKFG